MIFKSAVLALLAVASQRPEVAATSVRDQDNWKSTGFDDGTLDPFFAQSVAFEDLAKNGFTFPSRSGGRHMKITWREDEYDGTRSQRGHEIKHGLVSDYEIFCGYEFWVPPVSGGSAQFPDDKNTIVWQLYDWNSAGCSNWTAHMTIKNNKLVLSYRPACVEPTEVTVLDDIPRRKYMSIMIRARAGRGTGEFDIFVDGQQKVNLRGISFGFGDFASDGRMETSLIGVKMGIYAADVAGYSKNEVRQLYFDNMASAKDMSVSDGLKAIDPHKN